MHEGKKLKELFENSKLSIVAFSEIIGCSRRQIYNMFESEKLSSQKRKKIGDYFNFDFDTNSHIEPGQVSEPTAVYEKKVPNGLKITIEFTGDETSVQSEFIKSLENFTRKWVQKTPQKKQPKKPKK